MKRGKNSLCLKYMYEKCLNEVSNFIKPYFPGINNNGILYYIREILFDQSPKHEKSCFSQDLKNYLKSSEKNYLKKRIGQKLQQFQKASFSILVCQLKHLPWAGFTCILI